MGFRPFTLTPDPKQFAHKFCREERKKNIDVGSACIMLQMLLVRIRGWGGG